jgi:hypothetical protein
MALDFPFSASANERLQEQLARVPRDYPGKIATSLREDDLQVSVNTQIGVPCKGIVPYSVKNSLDLI